MKRFNFLGVLAGALAVATIPFASKATTLRSPTLSGHGTEHGHRYIRVIEATVSPSDLSSAKVRLHYDDSWSDVEWFSVQEEGELRFDTATNSAPSERHPHALALANAISYRPESGHLANDAAPNGVRWRWESEFYRPGTVTMHPTDATITNLVIHRYNPAPPPDRSKYSADGGSYEGYCDGADQFAWRIADDQVALGTKKTGWTTRAEAGIASGLFVR